MPTLVLNQPFHTSPLCSHLYEVALVLGVEYGQATSAGEVKVIHRGASKEQQLLPSPLVLSLCVDEDVEGCVGGSVGPGVGG